MDMRDVEMAAEILCSTTTQTHTIATVGVIVGMAALPHTSNNRIHNGHHTIPNRAMAATTHDPHQLMVVRPITRAPVGVRLVEEVLPTNTTLMALEVAAMDRPTGVLVVIMAGMVDMAVVGGIRVEAVIAATAAMAVTEGRLPMATVVMAPVVMAPVVDHTAAGAEADIDYCSCDF